MDKKELEKVRAELQIQYDRRSTGTGQAVLKSRIGYLDYKIALLTAP